MTQENAAKSFNDEAARLAPVTAEQYKDLLEKLLTEGQIYTALKPEPDGQPSYRMIVRLPEDTVIPVQWGQYPIPAGGGLVIRPETLRQVVIALEAIKSGHWTAEDVLFKKDKYGQTVSTIDVYGLDPVTLSSFTPVKSPREAYKAFGLGLS